MNSTTSQGPSNTIYRYTADLRYILGKESFEIETSAIKTIAIDNDYIDKNMPMIFLTLGVYQSLANKMILNQDRGIFILDIKKCVYNSDMPGLYRNYISDKFVYFIAGNIDTDASVEYKEDEPDENVIVTLGLLSLDHVNKNKKTVNGILNGKLSSIMYYLTSHLPILIEPPKNNVQMEDMILPPMNSVAKSLDYLNSLHVFYTTPYRFFVDFDKAYLISSSGKAIKAKNEDISTVIMNIFHWEDDPESKIQGMNINTKQSIYTMNISSADCDISDNNLPEKLFRNVTAANTSGNKISGKLTHVSSNSPIVNKTRTVRIGNDNDGLLNHMIHTIDSSAVQIVIQKTDLDSSVFTINKEYYIDASSGYNTDAYNGKYLLVRKRELYVRDDDTFTMNTMLLFRKVPNTK